ncbi:hypothetical protein HanHA300_Chr07g0238151 [Helianthus annuus]|nr:hypothetical protein HanHA300_Chr07g0238151 [Helianthus annuus]KAJ0562757.1 hypothetical protein HanHA89_Chr07g0255331 [Helianthus annuus]
MSTKTCWRVYKFSYIVYTCLKCLLNSKCEIPYHIDSIYSKRCYSMCPNQSLTQLKCTQTSLSRLT